VEDKWKTVEGPEDVRKQVEGQELEGPEEVRKAMGEGRRGRKTWESNGTLQLPSLANLEDMFRNSRSRVVMCQAR